MPPRGFEMSCGATVSIAAHVLFFVLMLGSSVRLFQEERSAGAPNQVWGMTASSLGVELAPTHMIESAANPAKDSTETLEPVNEPVEELETAEVAEVEPETTKPIEEAKPIEADETVEADTVPEAFEPIAGTSETEIAAVKPDSIEAIDPEETEVAKEPPPPQQTAAVEQTASGGPVGVVAGHGGTRNDTAGDAELSSYSGLVAAHLRRHKRYPPAAERSGIRGTVRIAFSVGAHGEVVASRIVASSGSSLLDAEALAMVSRAAPFPPVPPGLSQDVLNFTVPVRFQH